VGGGGEGGRRAAESGGSGEKGLAKSYSLLLVVVGCSGGVWSAAAARETRSVAVTLGRGRRLDNLALAVPGRMAHGSSSRASAQ
jgi:hypothetical protein